VDRIHPPMRCRAYAVSVRFFRRKARKIVHRGGP
jgi:hypothetical protein